MPTPRKRTWLAIIGPGILVAATGVGAGDLATGAFTGSRLGLAVLWVVIVGAALKFTMNEGLARWQLVTGLTLLEGVAAYVGRWAIWMFLAYLVLWTYFVASALMGACGVAMNAILPLFPTPFAGKIAFGILHSAVAVALIRWGGYRAFEWVMSVCVAAMFVIVVGTAIVLGPDWWQLGKGLVVPTIPDLGGQGLSWTVALMGGIGGTVTVLCYGYWIREENRTGPEQIRTCRLDLACGYIVTGLFGLGMVVIGSELLDLQGDPSKGTSFILTLSKQIEARLGGLGSVGRWGFVIGAWCAVYSSMLGVWQSVPFLFADCWRLAAKGEVQPQSAVDTRGRPYVLYQLGLATIPAIGLFYNFEAMQKLNAIVGATMIPTLAIVLLYLNRRGGPLATYGNSLWTQIVLLAALVCFAIAGVYEMLGQFS
jgi:Mn2+/Fe2+ NRAMP family transporter